MKALVCPTLGPAENLLVTEVAAPMPGGGEALVEIAYAGLNFFDTLIIEGKYQVRPKPPFSPGTGNARLCCRRAGHGLLLLRRGCGAYCRPDEPADEDP
jgi:NADPH2:quinone reductase